VGTPVTFTATVAGDSSGIPAGTVRFDAGGTPISGCEGVSMTAGAASCTVTLPVGTQRIVSGYSGDAAYDPASAEITDYAVVEPLAFTGDTGAAGTSATATAEDEALAATGADVNGVALGALLLILAGGGIVVLSSPSPTARRAARPGSGPARPTYRGSR